MKLFKKKCAYCNKKIEKGKEVFAEVKIPEFIDRKIKVFCSGDHFKKYLLENKETQSKSACINCLD